MSVQQNELLLIAIVPSELKDNLVDALMSSGTLSGFSLSKIQGFSQAHHHYNLKEQVEGYRDFYRFELLHATDESDALKALLSTVSDQQSIRYWLQPLIESGVL